MTALDDNGDKTDEDWGLGVTRYQGINSQFLSFIWKYRIFCIIFIINMKINSPFVGRLHFKTSFVFFADEP